MTKQVIGIGSAPNDGTGDSARTAGGKINQNFTELYNNGSNFYAAPSSGSTGIQAAIDAASAAGGGTVFLASGTYTIDTPVTLKTGVSVIGVPSQYLGSAFLDSQWVPTGGTIFAAGSATQGIIANSTNLGSPPSPWAPNAITGVRIQGITLSGFVDGMVVGGVNNPGFGNSTVEDMRFYNCSGWGLQLRNFSGCTFRNLRANKCQHGMSFLSAVSATVQQMGNSIVDWLLVDLSTIGAPDPNYSKSVWMGTDPAAWTPTATLQLNEMKVSNVEVFGFGLRTSITDTATYSQTAITFTGTPASGSTSATLNANWSGATGVYTIKFTSGETRWVTLTNGSTACSWSGQAGLYAGAGGASATACKITITTSGAKFPVGMPVSFTTSTNQIKANQAYMVVAQNGNTIVVGNTKSAGYSPFQDTGANYGNRAHPIWCDSSGSTTITQAGFPMLELSGIALSTSGGDVSNGTFHDLDLEGKCIGGLYVESGFNLHFHIAEMTTPAGALTGFPNVVLRGSTNCVVQSAAPAVEPDADSTSSGTWWFGRHGKQTNAVFRGVKADASDSNNVYYGMHISLGYNGKTPDLIGNYGGGLLANIPMPRYQTAYATGGFTLAAFQGTDIVSLEASTTSQQWTLPYLVATGTLGNATYGMQVTLINPGNQATPQTCTVVKNPTAGTGQNIYGGSVSGTGYGTITLAPNTSCTLVSCRNVANNSSYWMVVANNGATFS